MKKVSILLIVAIMAANPFMYAQSSQMFEKTTFEKSIGNASDADKVTMENIKMANEKMYNDFSKRFKNASDVQANKVHQYTIISCSADGKYSRSLYNKKGRWQHTVTTYGSEQLPENIRQLIEDAYPRYNIFGATVEVTAASGKAHLVTIEDKKSWKRIRVVNGEMDVYEEWNKQ